MSNSGRFRRGALPYSLNGRGEGGSHEGFVESNYLTLSINIPLTMSLDHLYLGT